MSSSCELREAGKKRKRDEEGPGRGSEDPEIAHRRLRANRPGMAAGEEDHQ